MNTLPSGAAIAPRPTLSSARATISAATHAYALPVPTDARRTLARGWLWLALAALIGSGLFSVLLVLSRTPGLNKLFPVADFFRVALVVHVDLSVLVWFVALAGLVWSLHGTPRRSAHGLRVGEFCHHAMRRHLAVGMAGRGNFQLGPHHERVGELTG